MIAGALGLVAVLLLVAVLQDAFEVMLLPRRVQRRIRATSIYFIATWSLWRSLGRLMKSDERRERFLSVYGALSMVMLFSVWATFLILSFGLLEWLLQGPENASLRGQVYMSGVTFFTLGYGDIVPHSAPARALAVIEAGTGIGLLAVVIGYLPVLYQLFSRREAHVIQLDARAGSPPTATTMLVRHADAKGLEKLDQLLHEWEIWASELLESHISYPMLVYYRSQQADQSWLAAMAAIMDSCAMLLVGIEGAHPLQARMTFATARQALVEMAHTLRVRPSRYTGGDRLPHEGYVRMTSQLAKAGVSWSEQAASEDLLLGLRATYEPLLDGLASALLLTLPSWVPQDDAEDHWERGPRGIITKRLIEQLSIPNGNEPRVPLAPVDGTLGRRLRTHLRGSVRPGRAET